MKGKYVTQFYFRKPVTEVRSTRILQSSITIRIEFAKMAMRSFLIIALSLQGFQSLQTNKLTETAKFPLRLHNSSRIIYSDNINRETGTVKPEYKVLAAESPYNFQPTDSGTKSISSSSDRKPKHLFPFWSG